MSRWGIILFFFVIITTVAASAPLRLEIQVDGRIASFEVPQDVGHGETKKAVTEWCDRQGIVGQRDRCESALLAQVQAEREGLWRTHYFFEENGAVRLFEAFFLPLAHRAEALSVPLSVLEVGSFEGGSSVWLAQHMLRHPLSELVCIDSWEGGVEHQEAGLNMNSVRERFAHNMERQKGSGRAGSIRALRGDSQHALASLIAQEEPKSFDVVYIDGSHEMYDVASDALLAFRLLKPGGLMMFDDYEWGAQGDGPTSPSTRAGVDVLLNACGGQLEVLHKDYHVVLKKTEERFTAPSREMLLETLHSLDKGEAPQQGSSREGDL